MGRQRLVVPSREKIRNLRQYKDLSDEEFEVVFEEISADTVGDFDLNLEVDFAASEEEVKKKMDEFAQDYDLTDMKINDKLVLRQLIQAIISLEQLEKTFMALRMDITVNNIVIIDRVANVMSKLRGDISSMQTDLKLTRKARKESQAESFMEYMDRIKEKAIQFHKEKNLYIFCPKCKRLLTTVWLLFPDTSNTMHLHCSHCETDTEIKLASLYKTGNRNVEDVALA